MSKETYKALKAKNEHILTIDYIYNINGVTVNTQASAEICNRLVEVNIETIVPWTLETIQKHSNGAYLNQSLKGTIKYDLTPGADANKDLMGYKLLAIANASYAPEHADYKLRLENENSNESTIGFELINKGDAKYDFPMNDGDDEKDTYNKYTRTYTANFDDIDVVLTATVKLAERPADQVVNTKEPVTFTTGNGDNILFGYWDAAQAAYEQFLPYIGYTDQPEVGKAKFFESIQYGNYNYAGDMPIVNGKKGVAANVNAPFKAGDHKFQLYKSQLGGQTYVDGTTHTIVQEVRPYFHVPFTFNVNGVVDLPDYALDLDPVRVLNRGEEKIVEVKGEIANNVYTVDVSDLAKYYYVVNKEGEKSLAQVNPNDNLNVDFSLSPMEGAEETGYNFNADPAVTEYTLGVDWTGTLSDVPYILPMKKAVVNWGTYPHTEVGVNAVLSVNGFPIVAKPITLVTEDPLEIALKDVTVEVTHLSGTNPKPVVAKVYQNFELYSAVEEGNLFNNDAKTIGGLWYYSKADKTYGVTMDLEFNRVYYKVGENEIGWDESKIVLEKYTTENLVAPYEVGDLTGNLYIKADDGDIQTPIYVEFNVVMTHNIHDGAKTKCETAGVVTVKFVPEGYVEVAE